MKKIWMIAAAACLLGVSVQPCWAADPPFGFRRGMTEQEIIAVIGPHAIQKRGVIRGFPLQGSESRVPSTPEEFGATMLFPATIRFPTFFPLAPEDVGSITYMYLTTAPKPHAAFELYVLRFYSTHGLMRITALSAPIRTGADGSELWAKYEEIGAFVMSSSLQRPDLRAVPEMDYFALSDDYWNDKRFASKKDRILKGQGTLWRSWEWQCRMTALPSERTSCAHPAAEPYPATFFGGNRVSTIRLDAGMTGTNTGRVFLSYEFDGFADADFVISQRAEQYYRR